MFERFTDRSRRVIVLAQEEASLLKHNYIGTEHLLLGLLADGEGDGARTLGSLNVTLEAARHEVREMLGEGREPQRGHVPFTPRAKKVLELALREALTLRSQSIGSVHLLLGLISEGQGVGAQVIERLGASLTTVRERAAEFSGQETEPAPSAAEAVVSGRPRRVIGRSEGLGMILEKLTAIDRRLSRIERHLAIPADPGDVPADPARSATADKPRAWPTAAEQAAAQAPASAAASPAPTAPTAKEGPTAPTAEEGPTAPTATDEPSAAAEPDAPDKPGSSE